MLRGGIQINDAMERYSNGAAYLNLRIQGGCTSTSKGTSKCLNVRKKQAVCLNTGKQRLKLTIHGGSIPQVLRMQHGS